MKKEIILGIVIASLVIVGVSYVNRPIVNVNVPENVPAINLGAVPGPEITGNRFRLGGLELYADSIKAQTSTTTVCAIRSPVEATSTLDFASIDLSTSSTTGMTLGLAKATTAFATTTAIGSEYTVVANAQVNIVASTTPGVAGAATTFAPGNWFVIKAYGGTGTYSPVGYCKASWKITSTK